MEPEVDESDYTSSLMANCNHDKLHVGSGGFYILCDDCPARWVAIKPHDHNSNNNDQSINYNSDDYKTTNSNYSPYLKPIQPIDYDNLPF